MADDVMDTDTQLDDATSAAPGSQTADDGTGGDDDGEQYFLTVNERQRYRTPEEAQKAFKSAGERIAQLAPWEKDFAKKFGISNPAQASQALEELISLRERVKLLTEVGGGKTGKQAGGKEGQQKFAAPQVDLSDLSPQEQAAAKWFMEKLLPKLGYLTKAEYEQYSNELKGTIEELRGGVQNVSEERRESLISEGQATLRKLASEAGFLPADKDEAAEVMEIIEESVKAYIERDEERLKTFYAGGAKLQELMQTAFARVSKVYGLGGGQQLAKKLQAKAGVGAQTGKPGSKPGVKPGQQQAKKAQAVEGEGITSEVHDKAWDIFSQLNNPTSD